MNSSLRQNEGVTLLETLLVLIIIAFISYLSIKQYQSFRLYGDAATVQSNVDTIFYGLGNYYRANCYGSVNSTNYSSQPQVVTVIPGSLKAAAGQTSPYPISITTDLTGHGFMHDALQPTPLVNYTATNAYVAQFNPAGTSTRTACTDMNTSVTPPVCNTGDEKQIGTVEAWTAQVAVLMADSTHAAAYKGLVGADCTSSISTGSTSSYVNPCSANTPGPYLVWQRAPSYTSSQQNSPLWESLPLIKEFTQMYTTYSMQYLLSNSHTPEIQYFYCGN